MIPTEKPPQRIENTILATIRRRGRGSVFVPTDFLDHGSRDTVDVALHRMAKKGTIRRLARGVYDFPKQHPVLGTLQPPARKHVARALAGRDHTRLQPAGAYAANVLGLSEQVPAKAVFLTDGPTRMVKIGPMTIQLRRTTAKNMAAAGRLSGLLIQALRELGEKHVTAQRRAHLYRGRCLPRSGGNYLRTCASHRPGCTPSFASSPGKTHEACLPGIVSCRPPSLHRTGGDPAQRVPDNLGKGLLGLLAACRPVRVAVRGQPRL